MYEEIKHFFKVRLKDAITKIRRPGGQIYQNAENLMALSLSCSRMVSWVHHPARLRFPFDLCTRVEMVTGSCLIYRALSILCYLPAALIVAKPAPLLIKSIFIFKFGWLREVSRKCRYLVVFRYVSSQQCHSRTAVSNRVPGKFGPSIPRLYNYVGYVGCNLHNVLAAQCQDVSSSMGIRE